MEAAGREGQYDHTHGFLGVLEAVPEGHHGGGNRLGVTEAMHRGVVGSLRQEAQHHFHNEVGQ